MPVITLNELKTFCQTNIVQYGDCLLNEQLNRRLGFRSFGQPTIFLSYHANDAHLLKDVASFLYSQGYDLYIDWLDEEASEIAISTHAKKVKDKIKGLDKFILIGTPEALKANWNNWQLGFADAYKYPYKLAVFPIVECNNTTWCCDYLNTYPHIIYDEITDKQNNKKVSAFVVYPDGSKEGFETWLKK